MPTYEFRCPDGSIIEARFKISEVPESIPTPDGTGVATRIISGGASLLFKGSGFYITDYRSEGYKSAAKNDTGSSSSSSSTPSSTTKPAASSTPAPAAPAAPAPKPEPPAAKPPAPPPVPAPPLAAACSAPCVVRAASRYRSATEHEKGMSPCSEASRSRNTHPHPPWRATGPVSRCV